MERALVNVEELKNQPDGSDGHTWPLTTRLGTTREREEGDVGAATAAEVKKVVTLEIGMAVEAATSAAVT